MIKKAVPIVFSRAGGALCRLTVTAWPRDAAPTLPLDTEVLAKFSTSPEQSELSLEPGDYLGVGVVDVIEAVNGTFKYHYLVGGVERSRNEGDVNTSKKQDTKIFTSIFDIHVS
jgi:hypothetical protein